jgi:hypothetical protein
MFIAHRCLQAAAIAQLQSNDILSGLDDGNLSTDQRAQRIPPAGTGEGKPVVGRPTYTGTLKVSMGPLK